MRDDAQNEKLCFWCGVVRAQTINTMKTKTINLYEYAELSPEAKEKARAKWNETNDNPLMQSHMINVLKEKLDERGIKYDTDSMDVSRGHTRKENEGY